MTYLETRCRECDGIITYESPSLYKPKECKCHFKKNREEYSKLLSEWIKLKEQSEKDRGLLKEVINCPQDSSIMAILKSKIKQHLDLEK